MDRFRKNRLKTKPSGRALVSLESEVVVSAYDVIEEEIRYTVVVVFIAGRERFIALDEAGNLIAIVSGQNFGRGFKLAMEQLNLMATIEAEDK